ncbi:MAG: hypothetical protein Q4D81_07585 [Eubacteriales bacterium]|nr:hypothetical protein [Eubacteriales bacterium]
MVKLNPCRKAEGVKFLVFPSGAVKGSFMIGVCMEKRNRDIRKFLIIHPDRVMEQAKVELKGAGRPEPHEVRGTSIPQLPHKYSCWDLNSL